MGHIFPVLTYKAERAGRWVVRVELRGTTERCSRRGEAVEKPLWVRMHRCPECGLELDRHLNTAWNDLQEGLKRVGQELAEFIPVEIEPLSQLRAGTSSVVEAGSPF